MAKKAAVKVAKKEPKAKKPMPVDPMEPTFPPEVTDSTTPDVEIVTDKEAEAMVERAEKRKEEVKAKAELAVDSQDWTISDPVIPAELKGRVWVAVFRCAQGHKTKATNRQADTGVWCFGCRQLGKREIATIMAQFLTKPEPPEDDLEKRRKARKGAE